MSIYPTEQLCREVACIKHADSACTLALRCVKGPDLACSSFACTTPLQGYRAESKGGTILAQHSASAALARSN